MPADFSWAQISGAYPGVRQDQGSYGELIAFKSVDLIGKHKVLVAPGTLSYEVWLQMHFTGDFSSVSNILLWMLAPLPAGVTVLFGVTPTYATPVNTQSAIAVNTLPTLCTASPNISIGGYLAPASTPVDGQGCLLSPGYSDFIVLQFSTASGCQRDAVDLMSFLATYQET